MKTIHWYGWNGPSISLGSSQKDLLLVLTGIHTLDMFKGSIELLLSFVRRKTRTIKAQGISPYIVLANINLLASWLMLGNTAIN